MFKKIWLLLLSVGPGIFCIGYTIGTGSVTSMSKAGSQFGTELLWVLALSCLFSWVLMEAYGRYAVVTGDTAIHSFKTKLKFGKFFAVLAVAGVSVGQWCCLSGLVGLSSAAVYETLRLFFPSFEQGGYWPGLIIAVIIMAAMYIVLWFGTYSLFEKVLVFFVTILAVSFIVSMFIVLPSPSEIAGGFIPSIPDVEGAKLMIAAFVGTTMAAPTFVVRPLLVKSKGWSNGGFSQQQKDAAVSALMMFVVSGSIMLCAAGALFKEGKVITNVLDMANSLSPFAGRFAVALFLAGTLSAGLSSMLPIMMVAPLLISDYNKGRMVTRSVMFRCLTAAAALIGLTVPILGANPIAAQIATQVSQVFVLPLVIGCIIYLVNSREMRQHRAGWLLNSGLVLAFAYSLVMSYIALLGLKDFF
ncbi:Mramp [Limihaloglobus sulfuriphilus]|uniref:Mramp n=1 Tax=Limihaloglobus sulfuriphilus TaxID=1851148 RepID=A0A1Q2MB80_9BACT|nr:Nramp family divalent metal transporter [Limihaloglobus sulfuriphilus]AQQ69788.1 Mramp [Limihaloglobus sulfuriphilus]